MFGLLSIVPATLKCMIVPLPKGATNVDQYFAKRIQRMISAYADKSLMILFISNESHQQLIRNFYKVGK